MIGKQGKLLILLYMTFLTVLFLMCSTDLIIREPEKEIYQVAVIIEDVRDDNYSNFRKGMDQAAMEFNADVRFITLYEKMDASQQMELIQREQQDGTEALIIAPVDEEQVLAALAEKQMTIPVVLLGSGAAGELVTGGVIIDYKEMGELLARKMLEETPEGYPVLAFADLDRQSIMSRRFLEGASEVLEDGGRSFRIVVRTGEPGVKEFMEGLENWTGGQAVILAESPEILAETAEILANTPTIAERVWGIYGRGNTMPILNYLDRGVIKGICVADEFSTGYLSVSMAVEQLEKAGSLKQTTMDSFYIKREDLREPAYEKLLFPME